MSTSSIKDHKAVWVLLLAGGIVAAAVIVLLFASSPSGAASEEPNPAFSVLEPATADARGALPEQAEAWLEETELAGLAGLKDEPLNGLGIAHTSEGAVVVADLGQAICLYAVEQGLSTCGDMNLIDEGKLVIFQPSCPTSLVVGVLPDGVRSVEATASDGKPVNLAVSSNVYVGRIESVDTLLSATLQDGKSFKAELPLGVIGKACSA